MPGILSRKGLTDLRDRLAKRLADNPADACAVLDEAHDVREGLVQRMGMLADVCTVEQRDLLASEAREFAEMRDGVAILDPLIERAQIMENRNRDRADDWHHQVKRAAERTKENEQRAIAEWRAQHPEGINVTKSSVEVRSEPQTYRPDRPDVGYVADMVKRQQFGDSDAAARLQRHALEMRALNVGESRAAGRDTAGDFNPPTYLLNQYVDVARAGRVTADLCYKQGMPTGQQQIIIPRFTTGTAINAQTADNAALTSQDIATDHITLPVSTYGGVTTVSQQMLDLTPGQLDSFVFRDLIRAHAQSVGNAVLNGTGANGQVQGILTNTSTNSVTFTSTSPTGILLQQKVAYAAQLVTTSIYDVPDAVVMHPRRWSWLLGQVDSNGRPLITPTADGNQSVNSAGVATELSLTKSVGYFAGLPVHLDPNIPTNIATNQDAVLVGRFGTESFLYETGPQAQAFLQPGASSMSVLMRCFSYVAYSGAQRRPGAFSVIKGSGLSAVLS